MHFFKADPNECLPTLLNFLKSCQEDGSIALNLNELSSSKIQISIPERLGKLLNLYLYV